MLAASRTALGMCVALAPIALGQDQPTMIPTVLANAMFLDYGMMGKPSYVLGALPPGWPAGFIPTNARIIGSGTVGDPAFIHMQMGVIDLPKGTDANEMLRAMAIKAGYTPQGLPPVQSGFVASPTPQAKGYCKGASLVAISPADSVRTPDTYVIAVMTGEGARQSCAPGAGQMSGFGGAVKLPPLEPPRGARAFGGGSSWSGSNGSYQSGLVTTMPTDSILAHYTKQLVAAGWTAEGRPASADGVSVQRFSLREKDEPWSAALIIMAAGEKRNIMVQFSRKDVE